MWKTIIGFCFVKLCNFVPCRKKGYMELSMLPVMEEFYTIQGEGNNTGTAAYFIRLGGCDVGCHWCDVKESWDAGKHPQKSIADIVQQASSYPAKTVVITDSEPLMYDLTALTDALKAAGIRILLETSGAYPLTGTWDWICVSPKKFKAPLPSVLKQAHELKVIVFNKSDFHWGEEHATQTGSDCKLYLQPEWSKATQMTPLIVEYVKDHPQWKVSLQTHKFMDIP